MRTDGVGQPLDPSTTRDAVSGPRRVGPTDYPPGVVNKHFFADARFNASNSPAWFCQRGDVMTAVHGRVEQRLASSRGRICITVWSRRQRALL